MIYFYIKKSLREHIPVDIIYLSSKSITKRTIRVLKIEEDKIEAYCYLRRAKRIFKISNILGADYCKNKYIH